MSLQHHVKGVVILQPQWEGHDIPTQPRFKLDVVIDGIFCGLDESLLEQCHIDIEEIRIAQGALSS